MNRALKQDRGEAGFTLIELLIVVVVMGILATIVIPRFNQFRERSYDAAAQADLRNAITAQEAYFADAGSFTTDEGATGLNINLSPQIDLSVTTPSAAAFTMTTKHSASDNTYCVNSDDGRILLAPTC